jgi:hypothetical protein
VGPVGGRSVGPTLQLPVSLLGGNTLQEAIEWNPRPGVNGGHAPWQASHAARPAGQHLASYRLNEVGNCSWESYKYPLPMEFTHTTLYLLFSTSKGSSLVVEA